ncbi:hypothetical protein TSUD_87990 [Trifolium subterraneum]|uniref:Pentacotripeptide-repeat region of PRORP domain-containing protein n=1 Tax=Trifolium subterraneum TaxID=3900 RepID=A0A2Z6NKI8_TRISU|nr:hypothetical protein TSUD_87990 [Trifolium subterraneum]
MASIFLKHFTSNTTIIRDKISSALSLGHGCDGFREYHDGRPRGPLWRGKKLVGKEALYVISELKRFKDDEDKLPKFIKTHVLRLLEMDLIAVLTELERQQEVSLALIAFSIMDFLGESRCFYPVLPLYNSILSSCAKNQNLIQARKCLDLMEKKMMGKSEVTYTALLKLAVLHKNLPAVHIIWQEYIKVYSMSVISLRKFIWSFTRLGDLQCAYRTLQQMVSLAMRENISIGRTVYGKLYSTRLDIPVPSNDGLGSTILDLRNSKQHDSCILAPPMYLPDTKCAETNGLNGQKHSLLMKMQNLGLQPSSHTYDGIISAIVSQRSFGDAMRMDDAMLCAIPSTRIVEEPKYVLEMRLKSLGEEGMIRELVQYLHVVENLFIYRNPSLGTDMYNIVLHYLVEAQESHMAIEIFKKMKLCGCHPDSTTYNIMIDCCSIIRSYRSASLLISMMIREGFCPVACTYTALIKVLPV